MKRLPLWETVVQWKQKIKCYDNGGKTLDRYTIIPFGNTFNWKEYECLWCSEWGVGYSEWSSCIIGGHLWKRISFYALDKQTQDHIISRIF